MRKKKLKMGGTERVLSREQLENRDLFASDIAKWFATVPNATPAVVSDTVMSSGSEARRNAYIVQLDPSKVDSVFAAANVLQTYNVAVEKGLGQAGLVSVKYNGSINRLSALPGVISAERDLIVHTQSTNDPVQPWSLEKIKAPAAWAKSIGSKVVVGVIDTGIDFNHPDLVNQVWRNPGEIAGNGLDDDGNGFKDDVFGVDFANGDSVPFDDNGHGTHVSGTIAAQANNQVGLPGVAYGAKIVSAKFLGANGSGALSAGISSINYMTMINNRYGSVKVINASWGGGGYTKAMEDAIKAYQQSGGIFVAAAGNEGSNLDNKPAYPASYFGVVSVAATDQNDRLASFSNFGQKVDIAAPGVAIESTYPGGRTAILNGTSMAAPHAAGALALIVSANPAISAEQAISKLLSSSDTVPGLNVENSRRLNAGRALDANVLPPTAPRLSADNIFRTSIDLRWNALENVTQYRVSQLVNGKWQQVGSLLSGNTTKIRVNNLLSGSTVKFRVEAINSNGSSLSNVLSVTLRS